MPDCDLDDVKKQVTKEVKLMSQKTDKVCKEAKTLRDEKAELEKNKNPSPEEKKKAFDIQKSLKDLERSYLTEAESASERINRILKTSVPTDQKEIPEWQKTMAPWYREMLNKEAGLDIGKGLRLNGEISIKEKKAMIFLEGKF